MKTFLVTLLGILLVLNVAPLHAEKKIVIDGSTTVGPIAKAFAEDVIYLVKGDIVRHGKEL